MIYVAVTHIVARDDTIETIADYYHVTWQEIADANGLYKNSILTIGQELVIPNVAVEPGSIPTPEPTASNPNPAPAETPGTQETSTSPTPTPAAVIYTVGEGDYLELVAEQYGISAEELAEANGITTESVLQVGHELVIPNLQATAVPTPTPTSALTPKPLRVSPTPRPTVLKSLDMLYQQPALLAPANNSVVEGADAAVLLNWKSVGILTKDQWYQVRIWFNADQEEPEVFYTKSTSWRPQVGFYSEEKAPYTIRWQVQVVKVGESRDDYVAISPISTLYILYWR